MQSFEWRDFTTVDFQQLRNTRDQYHHAVQAVSLIGRRFLPEETNQRSSLTWIPGLSRLAGAWVEANEVFRGSLDFQTFSLFLVDKKVNTLASFDLNGKSYVQGMLWLEEHIAKQGLKATNLQMKLPYALPEYPTVNGTPFNPDPQLSIEFGKYYHNSYVCLRELKHELQLEGSILAWPKDFDQNLTVTIKDSGDPETNSRLALGMSPGDQHFDKPYFYVNTWPYVPVEECPKLPNGALWYGEEWTGAVLSAEHVLRGDQKKIVGDFYREAFTILRQMLVQ